MQLQYHALHYSALQGKNSISQSINQAAGDAPYIILKKRITGMDTVCD